ncbi:WXG100 family type VII secretion target [Mycobacterium sp.]|uniref:WXG100 family type VII secretion target n=1 Tax=Mycobacterium sp. TaxID=1785 RepID=UPI0012889D03|nr:WXG100 family type VII secretion target [Mycobacterium sp.]KAA8959488.1 MAG: WXG100 family type VII secretion target [Mycobacterium sp.]
MSETFRVDPEALADAAARMGEYARYAESMVSEIESLIAHVHVTWSGEAADAHRRAHRHWVGGEAMMRAGLAQLRAAGTTAHANYTSAMAVNLDMWS